MLKFRRVLLVSLSLALAYWPIHGFAQQAAAPAAGTTAAPAPVAPAPAVTPPAAPSGTSAAPPAAPADGAAAQPDAAPAVVPDPSAPDTEAGSDVSVGEVANIETEELTPDLAKKAIDGYFLVHNKYQDSPLEDYQDLQEFVDKDAKGKQLEIDIKAFGFTSVNDWNLAVTSVSVAYNNILDDQTADYKQQIEDIKNSKDMAQDMKDQQIKALQAAIPSENNHRIVEDLTKDPVYADKIKLLETTEE